MLALGKKRRRRVGGSPRRRPRSARSGRIVIAKRIDLTRQRSTKCLRAAGYGKLVPWPQRSHKDLAAIPCVMEDDYPLVLRQADAARDDFGLRANAVRLGSKAAASRRPLTLAGHAQGNAPACRRSPQLGSAALAVGRAKLRFFRSAAARPGCRYLRFSVPSL